MNESKCPHCGEDMVWVGDMLTGGLQCVDDLCLGAPVTGQVEELSVMGAGAYVSPMVGVDWAAVAEQIKNTNDLYKSQNPYAAAESEETDYLGDSVNDRPVVPSR